MGQLNPFALPPIPEWLQIVRDLGASLARTLFCPLPGKVSRLNSSCRPSIWCSEIFVFSFFFSLLNFFFFFSLHHWSIAFLLFVSSLRSPSWFGPCQRGQNHNYPGPSSNRPGIGALNFFFSFYFFILSISTCSARIQHPSIPARLVPYDQCPAPFQCCWPQKPRSVSISSGNLVSIV